MRPRYILFDSGFEKEFNKYKAHLTDAERNRLRKRLEIFRDDAFDKRLKTHKLKGHLSAYFAFSISHSDRIVFKILDDGGVFFIAVGSHDICY